MRQVTYTDKRGYARVALIRDEDNADVPELGIPVEPPPIEKIMRESAQEVQNEFVRMGLLTWQDVVRSQNGVSAALNVLRRKIIEAYKLKEIKDNELQQL
jgi:hypothetical protein